MRISWFFVIACLMGAVLGSGCTTRPAPPIAGSELYTAIFREVKAQQPEIVNSYAEAYIPVSFGMERPTRIGEWAFEMIASRAWVDEVKANFIPPRFDQPRPKLPAWVAPDPDKFEILEMPFSSFASAHFYIEKSPATPDRVQIFIHRH